MSKLPISVRNALLSKHKMFGRREYKLVKRRLLDGEYIKESIYGSYQGGSGLLVATNKRIMLVDRRPFFDYIEEAPYESLNHLEYITTSVGGVLYLCINHTYFRFRTFNDAKIKSMYELLQHQLLEETRETPYALSQINVSDAEDTEVRKEKIVKPLRRRARRHPAWSPHNPIMTGVISRSGIQLSED